MSRSRSLSGLATGAMVARPEPEPTGNAAWRPGVDADSRLAVAGTCPVMGIAAFVDRLG